MKTLTMMALVAVLVAGSAMAGGDKVRGDKGEGSVKQVQVQDPPPFQEPGSFSLLDWLFGWAK
ncbi:MAG: hypothetical protein H7A45_14245 [Verrucomicrobiales bacterium]|nr:hypothetical protein [Verrucomicrobiales bacterium]MCP5527272.1 hypothetical protein [Verrucomicrobiales bacterium]